MLNKIKKLNDNWVIFYDLFSKNGNGDSIRPIAEELRKQRPDMKFFFVSKTLKYIDMADEIIKPHTLRFNYVMYKAKYLLSPMGFPKKNKREGQVWVQTWHGTPLKKLYLSREDTQKFRKDVKQYEKADFFCISCDFCKTAFSEAMLIKEEQFLPSGLPRNDILSNYDENLINSVKEELKLPKDKKVLFYCPTWRRYDFKAVLPFDMQKMREALGDEYCLLIRSHAGKHQWVDCNDNPVDVEDGKFCFNVANYPDISHLYLVSDIHITDYSSSMFDYGILERPQIFYAYDLAQYEKEFQLYFDYKDVICGDMPVNTDELIDAVKNLQPDYEKIKAFKNRFCTYEKGDAAKKVIEAMLAKNK